MRDLIVGLARPMMKLLRRDDRGAVGVLIAILIGGGVLLGIGAMAIDVGQLYQNRAELQNGADAAALGVAKSCAAGTCTQAAATSVASALASANASKLTSGMAGVDLVCGSGSLGACPASTGALVDCPPAPTAADVNYVDVHTSTRTPTGTLLPPVLARTLLGNGSYQGTNVKACAQAEWGPPATADTIAFTISACTWDAATQNGTVFAPPPPYPPNPLPSPSLDQVLQVHGSPGNHNPQGCATEPAGADGPGNFGWTTDAGTCTVSISGNTYDGNTGVSASNACKTALASAYANKTLLFIPVYVGVTGTGSNSVYTLKGFAAFVLTGYHLSGFDAPDWLNPANDCTGNMFCLNGYFTQGLIPTVGSPGGPNLGADIIQLTG